MARAFPDADHTQPTHDEAPEPWHHPLLAGEALAASRDRLATAFGECVSVDFGEAVAPGLDCLVFVCSGEVRTVRVSADGTWERGRDPRVVNLCGPGSFAGLSRAARALRAHPDTADRPGSRLAHYGGVRWVEGGAPERVRVRCLPLGELRSLLQDQRLEAWFAGLVTVAVTGRKANLRRLRNNQLLAGLGLPEYNALLHSARPWQGTLHVRAGEPQESTYMVVDANVEILTGTTPAQVVSLQNEGDLIFGALLAPDAPRGAAAPLSARGAAGGSYLVWDRAQAQRILRRSAVASARIAAYADAARIAPPIRPVPLIGVVADGPDDTRSALLAGGLAVALATRAANQKVWLLDVSDGETLSRALGVRKEATASSEGEITDAGYRLETQRAVANLSCRVGCPPSGLMALAEHLRASPDVAQVLVHLGPAQPQGDIRLLRNNPNAPLARQPDLRALLLESLRRVPHQVVWLNGGADGWWTLTDEAPERLVRVDVLTPAFVSELRHRTRTFTQGGTETHRLEDDRPGCRPDAQVRIPERPGDFEAAGRGLVAMVLAARPAAGQTAGAAPANPVVEAVWRLERMVCKRSVGLALGGGGAWGAAHIGVIAALEAAGIPIDYVAGTSFGSVVGGVYAGGGRAALRTLARENKVAPARSRFGRLLSRQPTLAALRRQAVSERGPLARAILQAQLGAQRSLGGVLLRLIPSAPPPELTSLAELPLPFMPVSSNLTDQTAYAPYWLDFASAIMASGSLAPAFPAMHFRQKVLVDGAPLANVPAEALRKVGADFVIAVNVVGAESLQTDRREADGAQTRPTTRDLNELVNRGTEGWTVGWLALWKAGVDQALLYADVLVDLHVSGFGIAEMSRMEELAALAERELKHAGLGELVAKRRASARPLPGEPAVLHLPLPVGGPTTYRS